MSSVVRYQQISLDEKPRAIMQEYSKALNQNHSHVLAENVYQLEKSMRASTVMSSNDSMSAVSFY